jgi:asparagine synthase (glutamine-hydrolysing)
VSVQFGRWNLDGKPVERDYLEKAGAFLAPYGPDGAGAYSEENLSILYRAFHTTKESHRESQPFVTASGAIFTWDGRLDNRTELIGQLGDAVTAHSTDLQIVSAAYERWEKDCFSKLIGDWALSIWNPHTRALILAKDPIGTRHLYYSIDETQVTWSTILDPLVLLAGKSFSLCEEYIAGCFSLFPAAHLTPYFGVHAVPPSSIVLIGPGKHTVTKYWDFDPGKRIRYRTDAEYEEHFRIVFAEAVRRRLRSDSPILAELSGGMDSSSIVCMADAIMASGAAETPRLDTISYYDDSEPNWNERPYFTKVEEKRGRAGIHMDVGKREPLNFGLDSDEFQATPGAGNSPSEAACQFAVHLSSQGNRVLLSGIGGDEITGGVPTPIPEMQDLIATGHLRTLAHQLKLWALNKRKPWFHLLFEATRAFFPYSLVGAPKYLRPVPWLNTAFVRRNRWALQGYGSSFRVFGALPSFQGNISTLEALQRQLGCAPPQASYESRFPFLDRSLLEFVYSVPREQMVRPGNRRSLMRRALIDIVPPEILNRKRKAYVTRARMISISAESEILSQMSKNLVSATLGIVQEKEFFNALQDVRCGVQVQIGILIRTLVVESWLKNLIHQNILDRKPSANVPSASPLGERFFSAQVR